MHKCPRTFQVNGENLMTMEYDRDTHSETIFSRDGEEILTVLYNDAGQPTNFLPDGPFLPVNITYNNKGRPLLWSQGLLAVNNVFDSKTGYLTEKKVGAKAVYRFIYKSGTRVSL